MTTSPSKTTDRKNAEPEKAPERTITELEAEIALARIEMVHTINVLSERLKPKALADHAAVSAKVAAGDAASFLSGDGMPTDHRQARNVKLLLGAGAVVVVGVCLAILRSRRK